MHTDNQITGILWSYFHLKNKITQNQNKKTHFEFTSESLVKLCRSESCRDTGLYDELNGTLYV